MKRTIPACPPKPEIATRHPNAVGRHYRYTIEVITPLFGGGVEPGVNDPITRVRASTIRGHLRFWWRATRGARFDTVEKLRQREEEIWGSTENPSRVTVSAEVTDRGKEIAVGSFQERTAQNGTKTYPFEFSSGVPPYAAFPARPQYDKQKVLADNNNAIIQFCKDVKFSLFLAYPDQLEEDVRVAMTAWVNFGGIGARTRRGFGALYCESLAPEAAGAFDAFIGKLGTRGPAPSYWPLLFHEAHLGTPESDFGAWKMGIARLQAFRQYPIGRRGASDRSYWPEAEAVRNLVFAQNKAVGRFSGSRSADNPRDWHDTDPNLEKLGTDPVYFPRAEFGLPIIWEIRPEMLSGNHGNLKPTLQYDDKHERLASPLIIRPIRFRNSTVRSLWLRLRTPLLEGGYLKPGEKDGQKTDLDKPESIRADQIRSLDLRSYPHSPLGPPPSGGDPRSTKGSALEAFFEFLRRG